MLFLDNADITHVFKDKGKLNGIIKNHPIAYATLLFFFEIQYLFVNFIFEGRTFLPLTRDYNNCQWSVKTREKKLVRKQRAHYAPETSRFHRQGFPYWGERGSPPTTSWKFDNPLPPPPGKIPPTKFLSPPPPPKVYSPPTK